MAELLAAHADWSVDPNKRWVSLARRKGGRWKAEAPVPVGAPDLLVKRLCAAGAPAALGLDLPLGLPRAYAAHRSEAGFPAFLRSVGDRPDFFRVCQDLAEISLERPFYPLRGIKGMTRLAHAAALGFGAVRDLSRLCDRATPERPAGAPLFWTLGANQTGKAAISAWRDWLGPALAAGAPLRLWPFEGRLASLLEPGAVVLAEVYPAEALRHCSLRLAGSKRSQAARQALAEPLRQALEARHVAASAALEAAIGDGFGADAKSEDRFDSLIGLLGLIGVIDAARPDFVPDDPWISTWEGWVLGQTAIPTG